MKNYFIWCCLLLSFISASAQSDSTIQLQEVEIIKYNPYDLTNPDFLYSDLKRTAGGLIQSVDFYLAQFTNANIKTYGSNGSSTISLDGLNPQHTQVFWNGIPVNTSSIGITDISLYPFSESLVVDIVKSSDSYRFTGSQLGGAVLMENQLPSYSGINAIIKSGSYGLWNASIGGFKHFKGKKDLKVGLDLGYLKSRNDYSFIDYASNPSDSRTLKDAAYWKYHIQPTIEWQINKKNSFRINGLYSKNNRNLTASVVSPNNNAEQKDGILRWANTWSYITKKYRNSLSIGYAFDQLNYSEKSGDILNVSSEYKIHKLNVNEVFSLKFGNHELKIGGNIISDFAEGSNLANVNLTQGGLFSIYKVEFFSNQLSLETGIRSDFHSLESAGVSGNAAIIAKPFKELPLKFKVAGLRNTKYPSVNDLYFIPSGNPELTKESSWQVNSEIYFEKRINLKGNSRVKLQNTIEAYSIWLKDMIVWVPTNKTYWKPINLTQVHSRGIKLKNALSYTSSNRDYVIFFSQLYHFSNSTNEANIVDVNPLFPNDLTIGKQLPYIPKHTFKLNLYTEIQKFFINLNSRYVSERYVTGSNLYFLQKYWMVDGGVGYQYLTKDNKHKVRLEITLKNMFNNQYYQEVAHIPMPGINYQLSLKYGFKK